jgi:hypothetical protein
MAVRFIHQVRNNCREVLVNKVAHIRIDGDTVPLHTREPGHVRTADRCSHQVYVAAL